MAAAVLPALSLFVLSSYDRPPKTSLLARRLHRICHCVPYLASSKRICRRNLLISCNNVSDLYVQSEFISNAELVQPAVRKFVRGFALAQENRLPIENEESGSGNGIPLGEEFSSNAELVQPALREFVRGFELAQENRLPIDNEESGSGNGIPLGDDGFCSRRRALEWLLFTSVLFLSDNKAEADVTDAKPQWSLNLESYTDRNEGFTLLKPVQWSKVDKAGATVLFEDPEYRGNTLGVVVNPVRISSLSEFGTPDAVAGKLLQAEMKKPSTNNVELVNVKERQVHGAVPLYQLEYKLDSTRGAKRIFSAVTVASKKLYILNIAFVDSPQKPLSPMVASLLDHIVDSFDLLN